MTRAHAQTVVAIARTGVVAAVPTCAGVIARSIVWSAAMPTAHRLLFNNPESFCFDAKFSSESVSLTQA
jgi:hypothetical protein